MTEIAEDFKELLPKQAAEPKDERDDFLWVYDPQEAKVHIEREKAGHPAEFPTHGEMAKHVTHPDRLQGFAFAIVGGWRICDEEYHRIEDPFILKTVLAALRHEAPSHPLPSIRYHGDPAPSHDGADGSL